MIAAHILGLPVEESALQLDAGRRRDGDHSRDRGPRAARPP